MNEAQMVESVIKNYPPSEGETFFGQLSGWFGAKTVKDLGVGRTLAMGETLDYGNVHLVSCLTASGNRFALFNPDIGLPDAEAARERLELIAKMKENSSRSGTKKHWQARASLKVAESRARDVYESLTGYAKPRIKKEPKPVLTVEERIQGLNEVNKYAQAENKRLNNSLKASREECNSRDVKIDALQYELTQLRSALEFEREGKKRADALAERMRSYESPEGSGALFTHIARLFDSDSLLGGFPITSLCKLLRITRREAVTVLLDFRAGESDGENAPRMSFSIEKDDYFINPQALDLLDRYATRKAKNECKSRADSRSASGSSSGRQRATGASSAESSSQKTFTPTTVLPTRGAVLQPTQTDKHFAVHAI